MIKIALISAALLAGFTTAAAANALELGAQGRPHGGATPGRMLLYRHHLTRPQYNHMRMMHRHMTVR